VLEERTRFQDRREAGRLLGERLQGLRSEHPVVLGLPRGGVPVAAEVARLLDAPLDVIVVRKLGLPSHPEFGIGAVGEGGIRVLDEDVIRRAGVSEGELQILERIERDAIERRLRLLRGASSRIPVKGRTVVIVDDGIATGGTVRAAVQVVHALGARRVIVAVPVCPPETQAQLKFDSGADEVFALRTPRAFSAVGGWYRDFDPTSDAEVAQLLAAARTQPADDDASANLVSGHSTEVQIPVEGVTLEGDLAVPPAAIGIVLFAHGSGSSRHSRRNQAVAAALRQAGIGTLLFDLLTEEEAADRSLVFDIELLAHRLGAATRWLRAQPQFAHIPLGYFGASTGGGAALWAAAETSNISAVVSRGGRPDLAGPRLGAVDSPTLLIVGGNDLEVLRLNEDAAARLTCERRIAVVDGATHLFEEPGALETVARLAISWFQTHLRARSAGRDASTAPSVGTR